MKKVKMLLYVIIFLIIIGVTLVMSIKFGASEKIIENIDVFITSDNDQSSDTNNVELDEDLTIKASIPIFMYHWVREDTGGYEYPENMVKPSELRKQMQYLKENGYDVIFTSELDSLQHYSKPVVLTFDDGWMDVYNEVFPIAKELNMKFSMYVITDLIGTASYCTLEQLQEMKESGLVEINSHTVSHPYLDTLTEEEVVSELVNSKEYLKENLGIDSDVICYPSGRKNETVLKIARENYKFGLLMDGGIFNYNSQTSDMYQIPRIYAKRSMTLDTFITYCEESYVKVN